jgi:hypothetical protein
MSGRAISVWRIAATLALLAVAPSCARKDSGKDSGGPSDAASSPSSPSLPSLPPSAEAAGAAFADAAVKTVGPMRVLGATDLPKDIVVPGKLAKAVGWTDTNGENIAVFAARWVDTIEDHDALRNAYLTAVHVAYPNGVKKILRTVSDSREGCDDAAMTASFLDDAYGVTDLDHDGFGELTFAYRLTCQGHHLPFTLNLLMLENGDKYILRSAALPAYAIDTSFNSGPPAFLEHAKAEWRRVVPPR